jgi:hypothetical protein
MSTRAWPANPVKRAQLGEHRPAYATPTYRQNRRNKREAWFCRFRRYGPPMYRRPRSPGLTPSLGWARSTRGHSPRVPSAGKVRGSDMAAPQGVSTVPRTPRPPWSASTTPHLTGCGALMPSSGHPLPPRSLPRSMRWSGSWTRWVNQTRQSPGGGGHGSGICAPGFARGAANAASSMPTQPRMANDVDRHAARPGHTAAGADSVAVLMRPRSCGLLRRHLNPRPDHGPRRIVVAPDRRRLSQLDHELVQLLAQALVSDYLESPERQPRGRLDTPMDRCYSAVYDGDGAPENPTPPRAHPSGVSQARQRDGDHRRPVAAGRASDPRADRPVNCAPRPDEADREDPATAPAQGVSSNGRHD